MQFGLTETQQTLKNTVRKFLAAECPMSEVRKLMETATAFDPALWRKIAEQGWNGMILAEEHGVKAVIRRRKANAATPAAPEILAGLAKDCDVVFAGSAD